jgi:hypothetical protein
MSGGAPDAEPIVIGTGHAGMAAVHKLVALGRRPIVVDAGRTLEPRRQAAVERLQALPPDRWPAADRDLVVRNATVGDRVPRRLAFGSGYVYADGDPALPGTVGRDGAPVQTLAAGGYSTVWGGAMLAADDCDLSGWPISRADLAPYHREVLARIPVSAVADRLEQHFPRYVDDGPHLVVAPRSGALLARLANDDRLRDRTDVSFGQSRLAVDAGTGPSGCRYCGHCLTGCVYGSIPRADDGLVDLVRRGAVDLRSGLVVRSIEESDGGVRVLADDATGRHHVVDGGRAFLAAGAIGSTRIVLTSMRAWDQPVVLRSTDGFLMPFLQIGARGRSGPTNTLPDVFIELKVPGNDHWVHVQLSPPNDLVRQRFGVAHDHDGWRPRVLGALLDHALLAHANVHSDLAGHHVLTLRRLGADRTSLELASVSDPGFRPFARRAARRLAWVLRRAGAIGHVSFQGPGGGPLSQHVGASLPMTSSQPRAYQTDRVGRPQGWDRMHVIDSAAFSSVPATTVALLAMANATRVVAEVAADHGAPHA